MQNSKISWTDHTFNPWWGCEKVSPACDSCYAESFARRVGKDVWGKDAPRRFFGGKHWNEPVKWNLAASGAMRPALVFCASMADVFEDRNTHPTVKPIELMKWLLTLTSTPTGGRVVDPFMGSGSTLVAAKALGRTAVGIELEEQYCEIAVKRLAKEVLER